MTPLNQTPKEDLLIRGFKWQENLRPKSKHELMKRSPKLN
jgi:hypothetical protein